MTYQEIVQRASMQAHKVESKIPILQYQYNAENAFPSIVEELAVSVAMNLDHPWRGLIADVTANLANAALIPTTGMGGKQIIGKLGSVYDASDNNICGESFTVEEIRQLRFNPNNWRVLDVYAFAISGRRIYHTRTNVVIDVCVYDPVAVKTAIAANQ